MAMSGGTSKLVATGKLGNFNATVKLYVYYKTTQNVANNQSTVSCGMYIVITDGYNIGPWADDFGSYVGTTKLTFNGALTSKVNGTVWLAENKNFTVNHNADGTGSATIYWKWGVNSSWGNMVAPSDKFTISLPKIPRKSTFTATNAAIGNQSTITISRANSSFTHTLQYKIGNQSSYTTIVSKTTKTSYKWTIPEAAYSYMSSDKTATITLKCITYNGSTNLGYTTKTITATAKAAGTIVATNAYIGDQSTFTIKRNSSSFKHTLQYKIGSGSYTTIVSKIPNTSYKWTLPDTIYNSISSTKTFAELTIKCITIYEDSSGKSITIGEKVSNVIKAMCKESVCKPTLNPVIKDVGSESTQYTGDENKIIKGYNTISYNIGATAHKGASISSYQIVCGTMSKSSATGSLNNVLSGVFVVSATDSRGFTTSQTVEKELINYVKLTCAMTASASLNVETNKADVSLTVSGNFYNGSFGVATNALTVQYRYKTNSGSYGSWTNLTPTINNNNTYSVSYTIGNLDYENSCTVQARAIDTIYSGGINSGEKTVSAKPIFDWSAEDFNFNVPVKMPGSLYNSSSNPGGHGLDMNNSDIVRLNGLWFGDSANVANEGLNFARDNDTTNYDTLRAYNGRLLFTPNYPSSSTQYKLVYIAGDSFTITHPICISGMISDGSKTLYLTIPINRPILGNPTVKITGKLNMRGVKGYLGNASDKNNSIIDLAATNKGFSYSAEVAENVGIYLQITFNSALHNAVNNSPVACVRNTTLTIKLS